MYFLAFIFLLHCSSPVKKQRKSVVAAKQTTLAPEAVKKGNAYAKEGLYKESISIYKKHLKKHPSSKIARRNLGLVQLKVGNYSSAIKNLKYKISKDDFDAHFSLGEALRAEGKYDEAIHHLKIASKSKKNDIGVLKSLTWAYFKNKNYSKAFTLAKRMRHKYPKDGQVAIIVARIHIKLKKNSEALKILVPAKARADQYSKAFYLSVEGDAYLGMKKCSKAIPAFRAALKDQPMLAGSLLGLGRCQLLIGNKEKAISYIQRAVRIRPKMTEGYLFLAKAYERIDYKKSVTNYKRFKKLAARDPEYVMKLDAVDKRISYLSRKK